MPRNDPTQPPPQPAAEAKTFTCRDCGWQWLQGQNGNHDCKARLLVRLDRVTRAKEAAEAELATLRPSPVDAASHTTRILAESIIDMCDHDVPNFPRLRAKQLCQDALKSAPLATAGVSDAITDTMRLDFILNNFARCEFYICGNWTVKKFVTRKSVDAAMTAPANQPESKV